MIVLVRHGETEWSADGRHTGTTDIPLTDTGREQARRTGARLARQSFALVLVSPLSRARETCELAGLGGQAQIEPDLREFDYGEYDGITTPQIREQRPDWDLWRDGAPGGERPDEVGERADRVIARVLDAGGDVALFSHGHLLRVVAARWLELPALYGGSLALSTAAVSALGHEHERRAIRLWNDTSHL